MQFSWIYKKIFSEAKAMVLVYHRIAESKTDPWQLSVTAQLFEQQLRILKKHFRVIGINELGEQIAQKKVQNKSVCITFDDAYRDNYTVAMPLLERYDCPATFFIATDYIESPRPFWWDELQTLILETPELPSLFVVSVGEFSVDFELGRENLLSSALSEKHKSWIYPAPPPSLRSALYFKLWEQLRCRPSHEIEQIMDAIRRVCGRSATTDPDSIPMSRADLAALLNNPLFSPGMHTVTHPDLACHDIDAQRREIGKCKLVLEQICNQPVQTIAYPYGSFNEDTLYVAKEFNVALGFTTQEKYITRRSTPLRLGRLTAGKWDAAAFQGKIQHYFDKA